jgi:antitoxin HigA-1
MWKLSTTIKGVKAQPQTVLRVSALPKSRKPHLSRQSRDAEAPRTHTHAASVQKGELVSRLRAALDRHAHKQGAAPKAPRQAAKAKTGTVHRWHIPSHVVRHKIKPVAEAAVHPSLRGGRTLARHPQRPDLPERITAHPGEVLREEFLKPLGLSVNGLAVELRVPANRIGAIIKGERSVTADTALRLGRYFRTSPEFWMNLQSMHDLTRARTESGYLIDTLIHPRRH